MTQSQVNDTVIAIVGDAIFEGVAEIRANLESDITIEDYQIVLFDKEKERLQGYVDIDGETYSFDITAGDQIEDDYDSDNDQGQEYAEYEFAYGFD